MPARQSLKVIEISAGIIYLRDTIENINSRKWCGEISIHIRYRCHGKKVVSGGSDRFLSSELADFFQTANRIRWKTAGTLAAGVQFKQPNDRLSNLYLRRFNTVRDSVTGIIPAIARQPDYLNLLFYHGPGPSDEAGRIGCPSFRGNRNARNT